MQIIDLNWEFEKINEALKEGDQFKTELTALDHVGKKRFRNLVHTFLKPLDSFSISEEVSSSLLELAFNALKANYSYVTALELMFDRMKDKRDKISEKEIFSDKILESTYNGLVVSREVNEKVKKILKEERSVFTVKEKAEKEGRSLTWEETKEISKKLSTQTKIAQQRVGIALTIVQLGKKVVFDMINTAPLTAAGHKRITTKRENFRKYYNEDRIADFYMENLDETESAGFGSAMIDGRLLEWGLNPEQSFTVSNVNNKTCATISIDFAKVVITKKDE